MVQSTENANNYFKFSQKKCFYQDNFKVFSMLHPYISYFVFFALCISLACGNCLIPGGLVFLPYQPRLHVLHQ